MQSQPSAAKPSRAEVTFCAVERVGAQTFLVVCTTLSWQVYRLDKFSSSRDSLTPVQIVLDDTRDGPLLSSVRMMRLFRLPAIMEATAGALGGVVISERCQEVDYSHVASSQPALDAPSAADSSDDLTIFSFANERILKQLPPTPAAVVDLQIQRSTAAVLCESHEILLVDLVAMEVRQRISSLASLAMALGPRWIAYPGLSPAACDEDSDSEDGEEVVPEALVHGGSRQLLASAVGRNAGAMASPTAPPNYNAIDVAQNVASGLYYLSKTIAPYLSSSPATGASAGNGNTLASKTADISGTPTDVSYVQPSQTSTASPHAGWVTIQDLRTGRIVTSFQCHSTALVHLAFDFSGSLLATSSTKGQNVHVYRLLPPLQQAARGRARPSRHQLLYKLQRGITHASIADLSFSQDAKWLSVTSAHGTSHLYAIHPEGAAMSVHTHTTVDERVGGSHTGEDHSTDRDVSDFCASFRPIEAKTLSRVLKIHHSLLAANHTPAAAATVSSASTSYGSFGMSASSAFYYSSPPGTLMGTALDASQALFNQLAQSTGIDFSSFDGQDMDIASRRRRRRRRISCLFSHDGLKFVICCDGTLKLYDMKVHAPQSVTGRRSSGTSVKTRSSAFGFDATIAELKTWDLLEQTPRIRTESLSAGSATDDETTAAARAKAPTSEMRTFLQRGLPLWAHPKVSFRVIDSESPDGLVLQVKRKGPSTAMTQEYGVDNVVHGDDDQQLFVMEMDSYFGLGGSPVFNGQSDQRVAPEVPRLDLAESMNMAMSTSLKTPTYVSVALHSDGKIKIIPPELTEDEHGTPVTATNGKGKKKKQKKQTAGSSSGSQASSPESSTSTSASSSPSILQFTLQDMYFALPTEQS